MIPKG